MAGKALESTCQNPRDVHSFFLWWSSGQPNHLEKGLGCHTWPDRSVARGRVWRWWPSPTGPGRLYDRQKKQDGVLAKIYNISKIGERFVIFNKFNRQMLFISQSYGLGGETDRIIYQNEGLVTQCDDDKNGSDKNEKGINKSLYVSPKKNKGSHFQTSEIHQTDCLLEIRNILNLIISSSTDLIDKNMNCDRDLVKTQISNMLVPHGSMPEKGVRADPSREGCPSSRPETSPKIE